MVCSC
ncbi:hypothetical protein VCHC41A1_1777, partial [Vibrio cholerae HC-41A1]